MSLRDRRGGAKRADRPRTVSRDVARADRPAVESPAPENTRLAETDAELQTEVDEAADELRETGVAKRIAAGDATAATAPRARTDAVRETAPRTAPATLPYVDDRVSKVWVVLITLTFVAVFGYAFLAGKGGYLTRTPSPSPSPSITASPSGSPSVSPSPTSSPTSSPVTSPSP